MSSPPLKERWKMGVGCCSDICNLQNRREKNFTWKKKMNDHSRLRVAKLNHLWVKDWVIINLKMCECALYTVQISSIYPPISWLSSHSKHPFPNSVLTPTHRRCWVHSLFGLAMIVSALLLSVSWLQPSKIFRGNTVTKHSLPYRPRERWPQHSVAL